MSVKVEASGRRSVEVEFEVDGTPEQVWAAIATGPGISAWAVPTVVDEADGKPSLVRMTWGPGFESKARVTAFEAPHRLVMEADNWMPDAPPIAGEWTIQARAGGTCTLRIVQSLFASGDDWDNQLETLDSGWSAFLATLRLYLKHFRGQRATLKSLMVPATGTEAQVWDKLMRTLGLQGVAVGQRWSAAAGAPSLGGVLEYLHALPYDALVRAESPRPGIAAFGTVSMGGPVMVGINRYSYGDGGDAAADQELAQWQAWFAEHFPAPQGAEESAGT